jgi:hypothetical protein
MHYWILKESEGLWNSIVSDLKAYFYDPNPAGRPHPITHRVDDSVIEQMADVIVDDPKRYLWIDHELLSLAERIINRREERLQ